MKSHEHKQNLYEKEKRRMRKIHKMTSEQLNKSNQDTLSRMKRKNEIREGIINIISKEKNLAIEDIRKRMGINHSTFYYWLKKLEKEGWFKRETIKTEGFEKRGNPKTLVLNEKRIQEAEQYSYRSYKSLEEWELKNILTNKILDEVEKEQSQPKQHKGLIRLFKEFQKDNFGARIIFLLYDPLIKITYKLKLTDKGIA